jgi:hypothetical protein
MPIPGLPHRWSVVSFRNTASDSTAAASGGSGGSMDIRLRCGQQMREVMGFQVNPTPAQSMLSKHLKFRYLPQLHSFISVMQSGDC